MTDQLPKIKAALAEASLKFKSGNQRQVSRATFSDSEWAEIQQGMEWLIGEVERLRLVELNAKRMRSFEQDAMRYRWLRHGDNDELVLIDGTEYMKRNEDLDEAIDRGIAIDLQLEQEQPK